MFRIAICPNVSCFLSFHLKLEFAKEHYSLTQYFILMPKGIKQDVLHLSENHGLKVLKTIYISDNKFLWISTTLCFLNTIFNGCLNLVLPFSRWPHGNFEKKEYSGRWFYGDGFSIKPPSASYYWLTENELSPDDEKHKYQNNDNIYLFDQRGEVYNKKFFDFVINRLQSSSKYNAIISNEANVWIFPRFFVNGAENSRCTLEDEKKMFLSQVERICLHSSTKNNILMFHPGTSNKTVADILGHLNRKNSPSASQFIVEKLSFEIWFLTIFNNVKMVNIFVGSRGAVNFMKSLSYYDYSVIFDRDLLHRFMRPVFASRRIKQQEEFK